MTGHRKGLTLLLLGLTSMVFALVALELGLRAIHAIHHWGYSRRLFHQESSIPGLDYDMTPNREVFINGISIKTNQYGMRDWEPFVQESESPCRIAALGDSYTFGMGVAAAETYPKVLEKLLRESEADKECKFEVLNFGVVGYSSADEDLMLKYRAVNFDPHVVILGYVLNDPEIDPVQPNHAFFAKQPWWEPYRLVRYLTQVKADWDLKVLGGGDYYVYLHALGHRKWRSVVDAFSDIREVTSRRNTKVLVVVFPMITPSFKGRPWTKYPYTKIHRQVSDLAVRNGFRVVDLRDAFSGYPSEALVLPGTDDHPNARGYEVAARAIEKELLAESSYFFDLKRKQPANASD
jgi:lysophospholipase L1-like esterase